MTTVTKTTTSTNTLTQTDVANVACVLAKVAVEVGGLKVRAPGVKFKHVEKTLEDIATLFMYRIIHEMFLTFEHGGQIVRSYRYGIGSSVDEWGPPPEEAPHGVLPDGTEAIFVITRNPDCPLETYRAWTERLGWKPIADERSPSRHPYEVYGAFCSGDFSLDRAVYVAPNTAASSYAAKEQSR